MQNNEVALAKYERHRERNYVDMNQNLPDIIRENEDLRQALLEQDGFMKYVAEHIDDGEDGLTIYARYQEHVYAVYRKENSWNPDAQLMSGEELWLVALGADNHLMKEFRSLKALERSLSGLPEEVADTVRGFYDGYMAYAWREYFERRNPEHCTDAGLYKVLMEQYLWPNGLAHRCMDIVLKEHHGKGLSEKDQYDYYRIAEYHYFYFDESGRQGKLAFNRLRRGVKEWLDGKDDEECRELAIDMLTKVRNFSQHIYNDEAVCSSNGVPFPLEDKRWLRQMAWDLGKKDTKACFYFCEFVQILAEIGHIWAARLLRKHNIDMHKLEEETYSFILPYTPKEDGYDYCYYVDHHYNTDNSKTCCVNNQREAKDLLYKSFSKESDPGKQGDVLMWTTYAKTCFNKAVEEGWMKIEDGKYIWLGVTKISEGKPSMSELAYFLGKVYGFVFENGNNSGSKLPAKELNEYFGFNKSVTDTLLQLYRANNKQAYRNVIDDFFILINQEEEKNDDLVIV